jgi:hypothetical protein
VNLTKADATKLGSRKLPAYVVGIDAISEAAYIQHVPAGAKRGFAGISCRVRLDCKTIRKLWNEVEDFWASRPAGLGASGFEG